MPDKTWMIYGANGYTGTLIAEEAVRRGHRPTLAGRSADKLAPLARRLGLDYVAASLQDEAALSKVAREFKLVFHAAGPFIETGGPMVRACLEAGAHYVDITGEIPVFEQNLLYDTEARKKGIVILSGAGFDVIPNDCLAKHVAGRVSEPNQLELAVTGFNSLSPGTLKTILEQIPKGTLVLRNGRLTQIPAGKETRRVRFLDREQTVIPVSMADLVAAYWTTGIPNITAYMALPETMISLSRWTDPLVRRLFSVDSIRHLAQKGVEKIVRGPDAQRRRKGRSHLWARAANKKGDAAEAWLETLESYEFTALAGVRCVEKILEGSLQGVLTPALAFGADFVLEIPGTKRYDR
jgi:short subunit dehydrogenase-like uncharacterized protein